MSRDARPHLTEDELALLHYGELEARAGAARHLMSCAACRAEYDELVAVLREVDALRPSEPEGGYGERLWERLAPRLAARPVRRRPSVNRWAAAAVLLLVLAAGFLAGRMSLRGPVGPSPIPEAARARILRAAVEEHLERSTRTLLEVANRGDAAVAQTDARGLLGSNRLYRQSLAGAGEVDLVRLLEDLERVLTDIANGDAGDGDDGMAAIRDRIEERGLLFKLRIVTSRLRREQRDTQGGSPGGRT